jgi:hypothetical protein
MSVFTPVVCMWLFYRRDHEQEKSVEKTLVGNFWFVGESVVNKFNDSFTDGICTQKKLLVSFH